MTKFRMYIDETGDAGLNHVDDPRHRFLSLTGVIIDLDHVRDAVHPETESLKARYFDSHPDDPVVFHRKELAGRRRPFQNLRDERIEREFNRELLRHLREWEYAVVTVCLDKKKYIDDRDERTRAPYHHCMAILLDHFARWLSSVDASGDVMAEERGNKENRRMEEDFRKLWSDGTDATDPKLIQSVLTGGNLKIKAKASNIAGLQLADMIAHPSRNEILHENGLLGRPLTVFAESIVDAVKSKYVRGATTISGKIFI